MISAGFIIFDTNFSPMKINKKIYSIVFKLPGMLYAAVVRCPHADGQPESFDDSEAKAVEDAHHDDSDQ